MTNELIVTETAANPYAIMPVMDYEIALTRRQLVINFTRRAMIEGQDYGKIPGAGDKPTLLKPGAEKLASLFGLSPIFDTVESEMDWTGKAHDGEPFFYIRCRCTLKRGDLIVGQGVGSCNSWEKKYRYRQGERVCPACGQPAIIKGKAQYGGGWVCFRKKNGCGAQYRDGDPAIEGQTVGQVKNPDPADVVNTIDKMAQKRALVAAVLIAVNASEMFTQDIEDVNDAEWTPAPEPQPAPKPKASAPTPAPADPEPPAPKANGKPARVVLDVYPARTYGDGTTIPGDMTKSIRAFDAYLEAHGHAPEDYPTLKEWAKSLSDAPAQAAQAALVTVAPDTANGGGAYQE